MAISREESGVEQYLKEIQKVPLLTAQQERDLARKMSRGKKNKRSKKAVEEARNARDQFIRANLRLVVSVAKNYAGKGLSFLDLIEEGNLGLLKAVERFDPAKKCRFSTYATWWIRQAIRRALVNTSKTVRVPSYMVEVIAKWKSVQGEMTHRLGRKPDVTEVADEMKLSEEGMKILRRAINASDNLSRPVSLDVMWPSSEFPDTKEMSRPENQVLSQMEVERIENLLRSINQREAEVLRLRYGLYDGQPLTLGDIGKRLKITRERVRQIEKAALRKLQRRYTASEREPL
ncbi:MAG: sigma-70 family RNA polymerase sigma factor [Planctomycetota bacterium]|jgi:RNA polymerase primary sigma factor